MLHANQNVANHAQRREQFRPSPAWQQWIWRIVEENDELPARPGQLPQTTNMPGMKRIEVADNGGQMEGIRRRRFYDFAACVQFVNSFLELPIMPCRARSLSPAGAGDELRR